jgi:hypothetical protein
MRAGPVGSHTHTPSSGHERLWWAIAVLLVILLLLLTGGRAAGQAASITPAEQVAINQAIDKGVEYLRRVQNPGGSWGTGTGPGSDKGWAAGYTALAGLALAESGVSTADPVLKKAANIVRTLAPQLDSTYEVSLAILFLDRMGDRKDDRLIQSLAVRLLAGQTATGGWSYKVPKATSAEADQIMSALRKLNPPGQAEAPSPRLRPPSLGLCIKAGDDIRPRPPATASDPQKVIAGLPAGLRTLPVFDSSRFALQDPPDKRNQALAGTTDNSNTHFAILGLWAARRHDVPVERAFGLLNRRFRTSQDANGAWGYDYKPGSAPAMTCVALLALAAGHVLAVDAGAAPRPEQDPKIVNGFVALSRWVGVPAGQWVNRPTVKDVGGLYYLWAIERIAVLYDLRLLANKDWYRWGAEVLVCHQGPDGSWAADGGYNGHHAILNTAFALMFLKRANLTADLSRRLAVNTEVLDKQVSERQSQPPAPAPEPPPPPPTESEPPPPSQVTLEGVPTPTPAPKPAPAPPPVTEPPPSTPAVASSNPVWPWVVGLVVVLMAAGVGIFFAVRSAQQDSEDDEDEDEEDEERPKKKAKKKRPRARASD